MYPKWASMQSPWSGSTSPGEVAAAAGGPPPPAWYRHPPATKILPLGPGQLSLPPHRVVEPPAREWAAIKATRAWPKRCWRRVRGPARHTGAGRRGSWWSGRWAAGTRRRAILATAFSTTTFAVGAVASAGGAEGGQVRLQVAEFGVGQLAWTVGGHPGPTWRTARTSSAEPPR